MYKYASSESEVYASSKIIVLRVLKLGIKVYAFFDKVSFECYEVTCGLPHFP